MTYTQNIKVTEEETDALKIAAQVLKSIVEEGKSATDFLLETFDENASLNWLDRLFFEDDDEKADFVVDIADLLIYLACNHN